ncbi:MAG: hypothetical protein ACE1Z2_08710 [Acidobacteriota bacterium]
MQGHRQRRDTEIIRNPHQPEGWWRDGIDFFVAPNKDYRVYGTRH